MTIRLQGTGNLTPKLFISRKPLVEDRHVQTSLLEIEDAFNNLRSPPPVALGISAMTFGGQGAQTIPKAVNTDLNWVSSGTDEGTAFAHIDGTNIYQIDFDTSGYYGFACMVAWNIGGTAFTSDCVQTRVQTVGGTPLAVTTDDVNNSVRGFDSEGFFYQTPGSYGAINAGVSISVEVQQFVLATPLGLGAPPVLKIVKLQ